MNLLVAYDFSPAAERALAWAADFQRQFGGGLHVVHSVNPVPIGLAGSVAPTAYAPEDVSTFQTALVDAVARHGANATTEVPIAPFPGDAILASARARNADMIVIGTHGRQGVARVLLGSVAEHVTRHADCAVVTLRVPAA